jgi:MFS family permease
MTLSQADDLGGLWSTQPLQLPDGLILPITLVAFEALAYSTVADRGARARRHRLYGWVFTAFMPGADGIVVIGGLIDRRSRHPVPPPAVHIGLVVGGLAPNMQVLVLARFVQGLGAGAIPPIAYVAIGRSLPERLRPQMFATLSTAWVLPGVIGPAIAGVVGETIGWRWVFLGLLPLIGLAAVISFSSVNRVGPPAEAADEEAAAAASMRRRVPLALVVAAGTGIFLAGLTSGELVPLLLLGTIGAALGIAALRRLTPPGTLRAARGLPAAVLMRGILTFTFFGVDAYVALALVEWRGQTAIQAGISLTAATLSWTAGSWIQAHYARRWSPDRFVRAGLIVVLIGLAAFMVVLAP